MRRIGISKKEQQFLHSAQTGSVTEVNMWIKEGINIHVKNCGIAGNTALHYAVLGYIKNPCRNCVCCPFIQIAKLLLKNGADINFRNNMQITPLQFALLDGGFFIIELLIKSVSTIEKFSIKSDNTSYNSKSMNVVKFLLRNKTSFGLKSINDYNVLLQYALRKKDDDCFDLVLRETSGMVFYRYLPLSGTSLLHLVVQGGTWKMIQNLIDRRFDIECRDMTGATPIQEAIRFNQKDNYFYLLKCGASLITFTYEGRSPLHVFAEFGRDLEIFQDILNKGLNVNHRSYLDGQTPLHLACSCRYMRDDIKIIKLLLEHGANPNLPDKLGETAVHKLVKSDGRIQGVIQYFCDLESSINSVDINGNTPLSLISESSIANPDSRILIAQLAIMIKRNMRVCDKNLEVIKKSYVQDYYNDCKVELERMSAEKICSDSNVCYIDFLVKDVKKCWMLARNEDIMNTLKSRLYLEKFEIYGSILDEQIKKAIVRADLIEEAEDIFNNEIVINVPDVILKKIFVNFNEMELKLFVENFQRDWKKCLFSRDEFSF